MVAPTHGSLPPDRADAIPADGDSAHEVHAVDAGLALAAERAANSRRQTRRGGRGHTRGRASREAQPTPAEPDGHLNPPEGGVQAAACAEGARSRAAASAEAGMRAGLASLDDVCLATACRTRVLTLQSPPASLRGILRGALRRGLELAADSSSPEGQTRGWKLFVLAPRMLLYRSSGETRIPPSELQRRCELFRSGEWQRLLAEAAGAVGGGARLPAPDDEARAHRATALVHLGELSAAGRALVAEPSPPGTTDTLAELRDPDRRPPAPYSPMPAEVLAFQAPDPCPLPLQSFVACLRGARRGSAAGPSGMTNEHLRTLLDDEEDTRLLHCAAQQLADAAVPEPVLAGLRVGRVVALRKSNGRVRALVVGDVMRRLVARTLAQQFAPAFEAACLPHQYGLSTRAGTEAVIRLLRAATEADARATVLSVDAVGAFDHVARQSMLNALLERRDLRPLLPYARQFYAAPSSYTWYDGFGAAHDIVQGEGGEQGDPLMPALFSLAIQPALRETEGLLQDGEAIFAFLDDVYVVASPQRVKPLHDALTRALWAHARVQLNAGKTRVWNAAGEEPPQLSALRGSPEDPVWVGDWSLPAEQQGLTVLGAPLGSDAFVRHQLHAKRRSQDRLLQSIPRIHDLQAAWLLLLFCAAPRANYLLRALPPHLTGGYASMHDAAIARCVAALLDYGEGPLPQPTRRAAGIEIWGPRPQER